jgi:hypothetical protein
MKKRAFSPVILLFVLLSSFSNVSGQEPLTWTYQDGDHVFEWDLQHDKAVVKSLKHQSVIWQGSLLPAFWLKTVNGGNMFVETTVVPERSAVTNNGASLVLDAGVLGKGRLTISKETWGIRFSELAIKWNDRPRFFDSAARLRNCWYELGQAVYDRLGMFWLLRARR